MRKYSASLLLFFLLILPGIVFSADDNQPLTGAEIISKHLAAVGGKEALARIKSRVAIGSVKKESEPDAQMAIMSEAPNRVSAMYVFKDFTWQLTYDGKNVIFRPTITKEGALVERKYREMLTTGALFNSISLYNILTTGESDDLKFEARGAKKVRNRSAYVVEVKRGKAQPLRLYFDAETFMWVRTDYGSVSFAKNMGKFTNDVVQHGEDQTDVDFSFETSDFKEVDGVKLPFKFEQTVAFPLIRQKSAGSITGTIKEYRHNVPIDPKMFQ
ncbi:MAG TPA: hypothetical protein VJZ26_04615 [Blastocatellia bacterium]|nr:hypothetical protein [Blastocatellia bacterium]